MKTQRKRRNRLSKYPVQLTAKISEAQAGQLYQTADRYEMAVSEIIRDLIDSDLTKLNQRYKKRVSRGQLRENADVD